MEMSFSIVPTWEVLPYMELWLHMTALSGLPVGTREAFSAVEDDRDRHAGPWGFVSASQPQQALSSPLHRGLCHLRYCWTSCRNWQQVIPIQVHCFQIHSEEVCTKRRVCKWSRNMFFYICCFPQWQKPLTFPNVSIGPLFYFFKLWRCLKFKQWGYIIKSECFFYPNFHSPLPPRGEQFLCKNL